MKVFFSTYVYISVLTYFRCIFVGRSGKNALLFFTVSFAN